MSVSVFPEVRYTTDVLPGGSTDLVFSTLVPKQQVTISYLYFGPLTVDQIHAGVRSDEGYARPLDVLPTPRPAWWVATILWSLVALGALTALYLLVKLIESIM
jgi:hypothetical protein